MIFMQTCCFISGIVSPMRSAALFACTRPWQTEPWHWRREEYVNFLPMSKWVDVWSVCASIVRAAGWPASAWLYSCGDQIEHYHFSNSIKNIATYKGLIIDIDAKSTRIHDQTPVELTRGWWLLATHADTGEPWATDTGG